MRRIIKSLNKDQLEKILVEYFKDYYPAPECIALYTDEYETDELVLDGFHVQILGPSVKGEKP